MAGPAYPPYLLAEGTPYIVFEYGGPINLGDLIEASGRLAPDRLVGVALDVARALDAAAQQGIIHRDVKPANILIAKDGTARLADFGLAISAQLASLSPGQMLGTPAYAAPEQILRPRAIDPRADMYALGATLYHAATGRPPFVFTSIDHLLVAHESQQPRRIRELVPLFDAPLERIIMKLLAKDPAGRFPTWRPAIEALELVQDVDSCFRALETAGDSLLPSRPVSEGPAIEILEPVEEDAR